VEQLVLPSPIGTIIVSATQQHIESIQVCETAGLTANSPENAVLQVAKIQLLDYFLGKRKCFNLPLHINKGTPFQQSVWRALQQIPYASTCSYSHIATQINAAKAVRAVGAANGKNPFLIVVPCHRVIGKNGRLTGFAVGIWRKKWLLEHERKHHGLTTTKQLQLF